MKLVYVVEDFSENGGVERIVSIKANLLASKYHHQVTLISVYQDQRPQLYPLDPNVNLLLLNVPFATKANNSIKQLCHRAQTLLIAAHRLNKAIKQINPDVIFFTTTLGALLLPLCKTHAKKIYESHSSRPFTPYHRFFKWMERKADTIVCLTEDDAQEYKLARNVMVIPNFIQLPSTIVKDYNCKKAIAVGRLEYPKGFDRLINSWYEIAKLYPDWHLDIYGEGSLHDKLQEQINSLNMSKHVTLCGRRENMMDIYPNYSLHVMSSHYEGQPMVLIEAQACGLSSVTFDFKYGAKDIIRNERNGLLVEQNNKEAFTNAICQMLSDAKLREKYGENAVKTGKLFSEEIIFNKWINLLSTFETTLR